MKTHAPITYSLKGESADSEQYYIDVARFTESVMQVYEEQVGDLVNEFVAFQSKTKPADKIKNRREYLFEGLILGVYYRQYGGYVKGSALSGRLLMKNLAMLRRKGVFLKKTIDKMRGRWAMTLLMKEKNRQVFLFPSVSNLNRLIQWLEATSEFRAEAARLKNWYLFFRTLPEIESSVYLSVLGQLADWFEKTAIQQMGIYTGHVNDFLSTVHKNYRNREDAISVNKPRVEYHLNMVAAKVMNEVLYKDFRNSGKKILLLPPCLKGRAASGCLAEKSVRKDKCMGCSDLCVINRFRNLGLENNFAVLIMHHASKPPAWLKDPEKNKEIGIIGAACLTNLISGGWTLQELNIPAQCVVLDHCGCKHWHNEGITTSMNANELLRLYNGIDLAVQNKSPKNIESHKLLAKRA